jgi:hypothetical protein
VVQSQEGEVLIDQPLGTDMNAQFAKQSLVWCAVAEEALYWWSFVYANPADDPTLRESFARCLYEAKSQIPFSKTKPEDRRYITDVLAIHDDDDDVRSDSDGAYSRLPFRSLCRGHALIFDSILLL